MVELMMKMVIIVPIIIIIIIAMSIPNTQSRPKDARGNHRKKTRTHTMPQGGRVGTASSTPTSGPHHTTPHHRDGGDPLGVVKHDLFKAVRNSSLGQLLKIFQHLRAICCGRGQLVPAYHERFIVHVYIEAYRQHRVVELIGFEALALQPSVNKE